MEAVTDVVVIGAGMAGLAVARKLLRAGVSVTVFEAGADTGGRVLSARVPGWPRPIELGPEFVHGSAPALLELVQESGATLEAADGAHYTKRAGTFAIDDGVWPQLGEVFASEGRRARDRSLAQLIAETTLDPPVASMLTLFVEGFHAADIATVSARSVALQMGSIEGAQRRVREGYDHLRRFAEQDALNHGARILRATPVRRVDWRPGSATVHGVRVDGAGSADASVRAACVVVALPLSILNARSGPNTVRFEPEIVQARRALDRLAMGHAFRVVFRLHEPVWNVAELGPAAFLHARELDIPTWWTSLAEDAPAITAWCGGPRALRLLERERAAVPDHALRVLAELVDRPHAEVSRLVAGAHFHDFTHDPRVQGAYPYALVGSSLSGGFECEDHTIFFAGDYAKPDDLGTVGSTVDSAVICAESVLQRLSTRN
jgi:monoamine oxidase